MDTALSYTVSIHYDRRLYRQDLTGSIAHAHMLGRQGIIPEREADEIVQALSEIANEIEAGEFPWREELEDIHMNVERRLIEKIGDTAGKLHTARSRNDQVATDVRLYVKEAADRVLTAIHRLRRALVSQAENNIEVVMPGHTHLQRAQPVLFAHHALAYFEMLGRDAERFRQARSRADVLPLGSGALAGVPYPIDREYVAGELGFASVSANSMDAVSDRDFLLDFHSAAAICMMHLSRFAEEIVLWSSDDLRFIKLDDRYTTGSSMMPQKRNPDFAELGRGRTGRVYGGLIALLTVLKGLPLTYNRDLQEDKEGFFDTFDTLLATLEVFAGMVSTMTLNPDRMLAAAVDSNAVATDLADYLVGKGMPFREAHGVVAKLSSHSSASGVSLQDIPLDTYRSFSDLFDEDVKAISVTSSLESRTSRGGTAPSRVRAALEEAKAVLEREGNNV